MVSFFDRSVFSKVTLTSAFAVSLSLGSFAFAQESSPFKDLDQIAQRLRIDSYQSAPAIKTVKIAILDNGFHGFEAEIGKSLPASTVFHAGPVLIDPKAEEVHGLFMAQIVSGLLAKTPQIQYELHLFSAFGYSNLEQAVQTVKSQGFDVVLYSQVWEYGGNGDGRGFINTLVNQATQSGALWINAAGNFGDATYRAPIVVATDDWAKLPGPNNSVRVRCTPLPQANGKCQLRAVLAWNDFKDDVSIGTDKDLDLVLSDDTLKIIRTAGLQQVITVPAGAIGASLYPREIVEAEVGPGLYLLRAKIRSQNFTSKDELKLLVSGDGVALIDQLNAGETLLAPADNASVITVGADDSVKSGISKSMQKPELTTRSMVTLANGDVYKGSSNAAAITAAVAVLVKGTKVVADRAALLNLISGSNDPGIVGQGLPLSVLNFQPTGAGCFMTAALPLVPPAAQSLIFAGAIGVATDAGLKLMTSSDPFTLVSGAHRRQRDDMFVVGPTGVSVLPRSSQRLLPNGTYEVVQLPEGQTYCSFNGTPETGSGTALRLPPF